MSGEWYHSADDVRAPSLQWGAFLFHRWAASLLPVELRMNFGEWFVQGASILPDVSVSLPGERKDFVWSIQSILDRERPASETEQPLSPACPGCECEKSCTPIVAMAGCLIRRFRETYDDITPERIEREWYSTLDYQKDIDDPLGILD